MNEFIIWIILLYCLTLYGIIGNDAAKAVVFRSEFPGDLAYYAMYLFILVAWLPLIILFFLIGVILIGLGKGEEQ